MPFQDEKLLGESTPDQEQGADVGVGKIPEARPIREREKTHEQRESVPEGATPRERMPTIGEQPGRVAVPVSVPPASVPIEKSAIVREIESILSDGLQEIYMELPPEKQELFRRQGEETASKIVVLLQQVKVQVGKVVMLIRDWLKIIPGVNKFFLEQEAKIKTDQLLALRKSKDQ
ncbi:MAG: hypothetical protein WC289_02620 [Patescibacteria group bacterium]|jgi:hypothetical protein